MATGKLMVASRDMQVLALLLLILVVLPSSAHASSSSVASTFCIGTQNAPGIIPPSTEITTGNALSSGVFTISISILALIFAIVGMAWAIGYALGINLLQLILFIFDIVITIVIAGALAQMLGGKLSLGVGKFKIA